MTSKLTNGRKFRDIDARFLAEAADRGLCLETVVDLMEEAWAARVELRARTWALRCDAWKAGFNKRHKAFRDGDASMIVGMDTFARDMSYEYPDLLGAPHHDDHAARLFDLLCKHVSELDPRREDAWQDAISAAERMGAFARVDGTDEIPF